MIKAQGVFLVPYQIGSIILIGVLNHLNLFYKKIMHLFKIPDRINLPTKIQGGI